MSDFSNSGKRQLDDSSMDFGSNQKRARQTESQGPSKVLHLRGLPTYTQEAELVVLCKPFGNVKKTLILQQQQQAFVQMETLEGAEAVVAHYAQQPASIRARNVYFQYSNRDELKTPSQNNNQQQMQQGMMGGMQQMMGGGMMGGGALQMQGDQSGGQTLQPNTILLVSVLNTRVPVTLENIHQIFKPYGDVMKIITFVKKNDFKALVQMTTLDAAMSAKAMLEGKDIYQGCCHLRIGFSSLTELKVRQNGPRSRDFTVPDFGNQGLFQSFGGQPQVSSQFGMSQFGQSSHSHTRGDQMLVSSAGMMMAGGGGSSLAQSGGGAGSTYSQQAQVGGQGCVIIVNNLPSEGITTDMLFTLFGVYGDVLRVKILFNKRESAMVQFASAQQAYTAVLNLNHFRFMASDLAISLSNHHCISLPRSETESQLTKDYCDSPIHRFKRGDKNSKNIFPPSQVLHLANIPDHTSEADLRKIFSVEEAKSDSQATQPAVQFFVNNRKQAYVRMGTVTDAVLTLMKIHNLKLGDRYLRVSFTKKDPSSVTDSDSEEGRQAAVSGVAPADEQ